MKKIAAVRARVKSRCIKRALEMKAIRRKKGEKNCQAFHLELIEQFFMCCNIIYGDVIK